MNELLKNAEARGTEWCKQGAARAPVLDVKFMDSVKELRAAGRHAMYAAWTKGWDKACIASMMTVEE